MRKKVSLLKLHVQKYKFLIVTAFFDKQLLRCMLERGHELCILKNCQLIMIIIIIIDSEAPTLFSSDPQNLATECLQLIIIIIITLSKQTLSSLTIDELGSWCLKGQWSWAAITHGEGSHHQRHHHTELSQWNTYHLPDTYQREGGEGKRLENKASKITFLAGQQACKCKANHEVSHSRELKGHP